MFNFQNYERKATKVNPTSSWPSLALIYKIRDHMLITNPIFCPLLSTIITPNYVIRHAIADIIDRSDCNVIWHTYTLIIDSGGTKVALFILYKLAHGPLYHLFRDIAELKSFLIADAMILLEMTLITLLLRFSSIIFIGLV